MEKRLLYTMFGQLQNALDYITQTKSNFMQFLDIVIFPQVAKQVGFKEGIACLRFGAGMLVLLQGGAAGCCLRMLLSQWCALWGGHADAAAGGCCRVLLQGAAAQWRCRVLLSEWRARFGACMLVRRQGAAARCCLRVLL